MAFLAQLMDSNDVQFVAVDNPHATRFTLHILLAKHEAAQISKRTRARWMLPGSAAKRRGGWPGDQAADATRRVPGGCAGEGGGAWELKDRGMRLRQITVALAEWHVTTPRGANGRLRRRRLLVTAEN